MRIKNSPVIVFFAGFFWLAMIVSLYYVTHKPFQMTLVSRIMQASLQLATVLVLIIVAGVLGRKIIADVVDEPTVNSFLQTVLGIGLLGVGYFLIGLSGVIVWWVSWTCLLLLVIILRNEIKPWWQGWRKSLSVWKINGKVNRLLVINFSLIFVITGCIALAPPAEFDALVYHLAFPKAYVEAGRFIFIPNFFWGMPQLGESLYTWVISLAGETTAALLGWALAWLSIFGMVAFTRSTLGIRPAFVSAATILSGYTFVNALAAAYVDWISMLFSTAATMTLCFWSKTTHPKQIWLAAIFIGFAIGTKYTAGLLIIPAILVILWKTRAGSVVWLSRFALIVMGIFLPWLLKNLLATGNPISPLFFQTQEIDRFRIEFYNLEAWGNWKDLFLLPWQSTIYGVEGAPGYNASIGPSFLILLPFAFLSIGSSKKSIESSILFVLTATSVLGLVVWSIVARFSGYLIQSRLYFSIFPALAILSAYGFHKASRLRLGEARFARIIAALILLILTFSMLEISQKSIRNNIAGYLSGTISKNDYLDQRLGWFAPTMRAVATLPKGSKALMLWEPRSYYCLPICIADEIIDRWKHSLYLHGNADDVLSAWRAKGVTHLLIYQAGLEFVRQNDTRYLQSDWDELSRLTSNIELVERFGDAYELYILR